jgi:hypothetical protein
MEPNRLVEKVPQCLPPPVKVEAGLGVYPQSSGEDETAQVFFELDVERRVPFDVLKQVTDLFPTASNWRRVSDWTRPCQPMC